MTTTTTEENVNGGQILSAIEAALAQLGLRVVKSNVEAPAGYYGGWAVRLTLGEVAPVEGVA